jgi:hypothetical protein
MASKTAVTMNRRHARKVNSGHKAKRQRVLHGTTPAYEIHTPEADAAAPNQVSPKK